MYSDRMHVYRPLEVEGLPFITQVDTGLQHCIALSSEGREREEKKFEGIGGMGERIGDRRDGREDRR